MDITEALVWLESIGGWLAEAGPPPIPKAALRGGGRKRSGPKPPPLPGRRTGGQMMVKAKTSDLIKAVQRRTAKDRAAGGDPHLPGVHARPTAKPSRRPLLRKANESLALLAYKYRVLSERK